MESRASLADIVSARKPAKVRSAATLVKAGAGLILLGVLVYLGRIDFAGLAGLGDTPWAGVTCGGLVLLSLPLASLRWALLLRALGVSIPFGTVFHFVAIGALTNVLLLGTAGGDAVRGLYAWRALGGSGGRVAASVMADRLMSLFG